MKLDKNPDPKEIQKSPELNDPTSNFNAVSVLNLNSDGTGAEVQVTPKPMDWKGYIFFRFLIHF